jgi:methyl-accepting chemotaxis protein
VQKLAEKSKIAADEIIALAAESYTLAEGAGKRMLESIPHVEKTNKLVQEIAAASLEQSNGANQVNSAIQQLNNITQRNAAASEELASNAQGLSEQARQMRELVNHFKLVKGSRPGNKQQDISGSLPENHNQPSPEAQRTSSSEVF